MQGANFRVAAITLVTAGLLAAVLAVAFVWSGLFDVAASTDHTRPVALLLHYAMERSVALHASMLAPPDLDDPNRVASGALHFATGCAPCHGAPGQLASPIAQQMTPVPPGLYSASRDFTPSQLFWIVKNGVKMTAMPAWPAQNRDEEIWAMVAFLEHLPSLKTADYARLSAWSDGSGLLDGRPPATTSSLAVDCARCHGANGKGREGIAPKLAGQPASEIAADLRAFHDGSRPSGFMQPVAAALTTPQIDALAGYYAGLNIPAGGTP